MHRSSPGRPVTTTPCFSRSALSVSYVPLPTFSARWLRSLPVVRGESPCFLNSATPRGARVQEDLPVILSVDGHAQDFGVELLGARDVADVQYEMVDPGGLYHPSALPGVLPDP